jgi:menaquinone-dependent protoporphyrinogen oxidase
MNNKILVTYASRAGSTAEVAQAIGQTLTEGGAQVDVISMTDVKDLSAYQAVVAGSAIRGQKWLPEAMQFMRTHRAELAQKPVAEFSVCITLAMKNGEQYRSGVREWVAPVRALVNPVSEGLFAGRLDFTKLPFNWDTLMLRLTVALGIFPRGDHRDWNAVRAWAGSLPSALAI